MNFRLIDTGWDRVLADAVRKDRTSLRLVCPFIKLGAIQRLVGKQRPRALQVITRFSLDEFAQGVSDLAAMRYLLDNGAMVRGVKNLHAKVYLFGDCRVVVTSANLTEAAICRNHEFGFVADDPAIIQHCGAYFDDLWGKAGADLTDDRLTEWEQRVTHYLAGGTRSHASPGLGDEGTDAGFTDEPVALPPAVGEMPQAFVKFFGRSDNRADRSMPIIEEVRRSGCHWACTYPEGKRPRSARDGAIMFMGRLVEEPADILIYGRAIGMRHLPDRDDATPDDIKLRWWKEHWPHYVRVHHAEFIAGTLANGASLNELMQGLGSDSFVPTQRNALSGQGNTDPRRAYRRHAAVELTHEATKWLNVQLQNAFHKYGTLPSSELAALDWPAVPTPTN